MRLRRRKLAIHVDRRNHMARSQRYELLTPAQEERSDAYDERAGVQLDKRSEGAVDLARSSGLQDVELHSLGARRFHPAEPGAAAAPQPPFGLRFLRVVCSAQSSGREEVIRRVWCLAKLCSNAGPPARRHPELGGIAHHVRHCLVRRPHQRVLDSVLLRREYRQGSAIG